MLVKCFGNFTARVVYKTVIYENIVVRVQSYFVGSLIYKKGAETFKL